VEQVSQTADRRGVPSEQRPAPVRRGQEPCRRHPLLASVSNRSSTRGPLILDPRRVCQPALLCDARPPMRKFIRRSPFYPCPPLCLRCLRCLCCLCCPRCPRSPCCVPLRVCLASPPLNHVTPYRARLARTGSISRHVHDALATATVRWFGNIMRLCTLWRITLYSR
jgi:hypothetical protein